MNLNKLICLSVIVILFGCQQSATSHPENSDVEAKVEDKKMTTPYKGTIKKMLMEGGFFGIVTDKGEKILPMNLDKAFQQDGTVIEFSGNYEDVMTIQQWGKPFIIDKVTLIKAGKEQQAPEM